MAKNYIVGAGEQGEIVLEILRLNNQDVHGFFDDGATKGTEIAGVKVLGKIDDLEGIMQKEDKFIVAIGDSKTRRQVIERYWPKYKMISAKHPSAVISPSAKVGEGVMIHPRVVVVTGAQIGNGVILNTGSIIEHHNIIGDYTHICPGAVLGGAVKVGKTCWIGLGTTVRDHTSIGDGCFVGMGANVVKDLPDGTMAYGNPAKVVRESPYN